MTLTFKIKVYPKDDNVDQDFHFASVTLERWSFNRPMGPDWCIVTPVLFIPCEGTRLLIEMSELRTKLHSTILNSEDIAM